MMIDTVTLNPAIDYQVFPDSLETGEINRYASCSYGPGGKGVNVSLLLSSLRVENTALGVAAGFSGKEIVSLLEQAGCAVDFYFLDSGHSRINMKICTDCGETDLNGQGPQIPLQAVDWLENRISSLGSGDGLVLAGSVPPSLPSDVYARLLGKLQERDVLTVVDAAGEALLSALPLRPFLIKPNLEELRELFGAEVDSVDMALDCARLLQEKGARNVAVSLGEKGALLLCQDGRRLFCRAPRGHAISTVGAGDSLVAGFLYGWRLHGSLEGALRWGVTAGSATAFSQGIASGKQVLALYPQVGNVHPL